MTIKLDPKDERLIQKRMESGNFATPEEVIHRALESFDEDEKWLCENKTAIHRKIERAFQQFERGEGLTPEESIALLESRKASRRAKQRRA